MPIVVSCPTCGARLNALDNVVGKTVSCPECKAKMRVPAPVAVVMPPQPPPIPIVAPSPPPARSRGGDDYEEDDRPRRSRKGHFHYPYCDTDIPPITEKRVSTGGWILFVILLLGVCTLPLCWIGLLIKDDFRVCGQCGIKIGGG